MTSAIERSAEDATSRTRDASWASSAAGGTWAAGVGCAVSPSPGGVGSVLVTVCPFRTYYAE